MSPEQDRERLPEEQVDLLGHETAEVLENRRNIAKDLIDSGDVDGAMALLSTMTANQPAQQPAAVASEAPTAVQAPVVDESKVRQEKKAQTSNPEEMGWFAFTGHTISKKLESLNPRRTKVAVVAGALVVGAALMLSGSDKENRNSVKAQPAVAADVSPSHSQAETNERVETGWEKNELDPNSMNRWIEEGFPAIGKAETKKEARQAAKKWLDRIRGDQEAFATAYQLSTGNKLNPKRVFNNGESTLYAEDKYKETVVALAMSDISKGKAPANGHNTGLSQNGQVVVSSAPGISGNREAIVVQRPDGSKYFIMERCAQPVIPGKDVPKNIPKGPTDEPERPERPQRPDRPDRPDRPERTSEGCPEGLIPEDGRCLHPPADGPPPAAIQHRSDPGRTPGYERGNAEKIVGEQQGDPNNLDPTPHGTEVPNSQEGGKAPGGGDESVVEQPAPSAPSNPDYQPGTESPGTDEGTSAPAPTEGSDQTSGPSSDPGMPGASSAPAESSSVAPSTSTQSAEATSQTSETEAIDPNVIQSR